MPKTRILLWDEIDVTPGECAPGSRPMTPGQPLKKPDNDAMPRETKGMDYKSGKTFSVLLVPYYRVPVGSS